MRPGPEGSINPRRRRRWAHLAPTVWFAVVALALVAAGCGSGGRQNPEAQPAPDATVFRGGAFDQLPRYPRSDALGPASEASQVVVQSFAVPNAQPRQILDFYARELQSWTTVEPVTQVGDQAFRGSWEQRGRRLRVSAAPAPTVDPSAPKPDAPTVQYSLQLGPPDALAGS